MQDRPDKATLLDALARFLLTDLQPRVAQADKGLGFRVLIAANLAHIVAQEVRAEERQDAAQLARLAALLPALAPAALPGPTSERQALILRLTEALCEQARAGAATPAVWAHARETLREKLLVINPRFDTAQEIE